MSKVKIQGNASGTGVVTLTAPNTNTDRTITLPDGTDTLIGTATTDALTTRVNGAGGRKNLIINGGMEVWQRGTTSSGGGTYRTDRFKTEPRSGTVVGWDRSTDVPTGYGFSYSSRMYAPNATDDGFHWYTSVELPSAGAYGMFEAGKQIVLSFWAKSVDGNAVTPSIRLAENLAGSNNRSQSITPVEGATVIPTTWTKLQFTYTLPTWVAEAGTLNSVNCLAIRHLVGSNNTPQDIYITGIQLELGSVATDFEHRSYGEELALCQRYYHRVGTASSSYNYVATGGFTGGSTEIVAFVYHPVEMRVVPSLGIDNLTNMEFRMDNDTSFTMMSFTPSTSQSSTKTAGLWFGGQNTVGLGKSGFIRVRNGLSGWFSFDAEL